MLKSEKFNIKLFVFVFILFIISLSTTICFLNIQPNDYWWHVKAGEFIVKNNFIVPKTDIFSWYGIANNLEWIAHEWFFEVIIYFFSLISNNGAFIYVLLNTVSIFLFLYYFNREYFNSNKWFAVIWIIIGISLFCLFLSPRPHMFSFLLIIIYLKILFSYKENSSYIYIYSLPIISIIWANVHGGSSNLVYILPIIFVLTGFIDFKIGKLKFKKLSKKQIKTYLIISLLSLLALLINPNGIKVITYPYESMGDMTMLSFIAEWRSPNIKIFTDIFYILPIFTVCLIMVLCKKNIEFTDLILVIAFSYLSFKSIRFSAIFYIVSTFVVFKYVDFFKFKNSLIMESFNNAIIPLLLGFIVFSNIMSITSYKLESPKLLFKPIISKEIINKVKEVKPNRLFNDYDLGGELIYNDIPVLIDARADLYIKNILKEYVVYSKYLNFTLEEKLNFDYYLVLENSLLNNYMSNSEQFEVLIFDENCVLYKKIPAKISRYFFNQKQRTLQNLQQYLLLLLKDILLFSFLILSFQKN